MNPGLLLAGIVAWIGVGAIAVLMVEVADPFWGFFPILLAVLVAWAIGEYVTNVIWGKK